MGSCAAFAALPPPMWVLALSMAAPSRPTLGSSLVKTLTRSTSRASGVLLTTDNTASQRHVRRAGVRRRLGNEILPQTLFRRRACDPVHVEKEPYPVVLGHIVRRERMGLLVCWRKVCREAVGEPITERMDSNGLEWGKSAV